MALISLGLAAIDGRIFGRLMSRKASPEAVRADGS
jgi:hypothetical protein